MAAILAAIAFGGARAAQAPVLVLVSATVNSICRVAAANLAFGTYDPLGIHQTTPLDAETRVVVTCTRAISGSLALQPGHGSPSSAFLVSGADQLGYALFQDSARTALWADYSTGSARRRTFEVPVYGRIGAAQYVPSGDYADTVTARLDF